MIPTIPTDVINTLERIGKPPAVITVLRAHDEADRAVRSNSDLNAAAIERQRIEIHNHTVGELQRMEAAALAAVAKELEDEEKAAQRDARQALRIHVDKVLGDGDKLLIEHVHGLRRALDVQTHVSIVAVTSDPEALALAVEDAELTQDAGMFRAVSAAALARFDDLISAERGRRRNAGDRTNAGLEAAHRRVQQIVHAWEQEHPTPAQRLRAVRQRRERAAIENRSLFADILKYFGNLGQRIA